MKAGQTVTWTNKGTQVHTATSSPSYTPAWDSGGLATDQSFAFQFNSPGTFPYRSSPDVTYFNDAGCGCVGQIFAFTGTIFVTP